MAETAAFEAVLTFNEGCVLRVNAVKEFGMSQGLNIVMWWGQVDCSGLYFAKKKTEDITKKSVKQEDKQRSEKLTPAVTILLLAV